jgi:hypothetical protein
MRYQTALRPEPTLHLNCLRGFEKPLTILLKAQKGISA